MASLQCDVVSARESLFSGRAALIVADGISGQLGILPGHTPLVTLLKPGTLKITLEGGGEELVYVSGGVLEVQPTVVTVLADTGVRAADLDEAQIMEARREAEAMLSNQKSELDTGAALAALAETAAQLAALQKMKNRA